MPNEDLTPVNIGTVVYIMKKFNVFALIPHRADQEFSFFSEGLVSVTVRPAPDKYLLTIRILYAKASFRLRYGPLFFGFGVFKNRGMYKSRSSASWRKWITKLLIGFACGALIMTALIRSSSATPNASNDFYDSVTEITVKKLFIAGEIESALDMSEKLPEGDSANRIRAEINYAIALNALQEDRLKEAIHFGANARRKLPSHSRTTNLFEKLYARLTDLYIEAYALEVIDVQNAKSIYSFLLDLVDEAPNDASFRGLREKVMKRLDLL